MPDPPRPEEPPTHGFTEGGHVVELPRTVRASQADPLKLVTGIGWASWYAATEADHRYVRNPLPVDIEESTSCSPPTLPLKGTDEEAT